jgi:hypothetical protein
MQKSPLVRIEDRDGGPFETELKELLDKHGDYHLDRDGTVAFNDFLVIVTNVTRQAEKKFLSVRQRFDIARLNAYSSKDYKNYANTVDVGVKTINAMTI